MVVRKSPVIEVRQLTKSFGTQRVLEDIDLEVYPGEIMVVIGGSGCGKSTLLRQLIGSLAPDQGSIRMFGSEITTMSEGEFNKLRKRFGVLFQSGALFNSLSVGENLALLLREHTALDVSTIETMVKIKLELVGLREHLDKMPAMLSGGMKKRAGLARAIALDPQILFYDEPTSGLDPVTGAEIDQLIVDLTRKLGVTSVVVTHEMHSAFSMADRMCMLDRGRIIKTGTRQEFESLRDTNLDQLQSQQDKLVRQFLRGDAYGPITDRKIARRYEDDLLMHSVRDDVQ